MVVMKELEELTREIREKLPRLKELGDSCKVRIHHERNPLLYIIGFNPLENTYYAQCKEGRLAYVKKEYTHGSYNTYELKEIIGKEPMLNDVLDWFKNSQYKKGINLMHELIWSQTSEHILKLWDLSKPYLKDQSPELIEFLHGLINH